MSVQYVTLYNLSIEQLIFSVVLDMPVKILFFLKFLFASEKQPLPPFLKRHLAELKHRFEAVSWKSGEHVCSYPPVRTTCRENKTVGHSETFALLTDVR